MSMPEISVVGESNVHDMFLCFLCGMTQRHPGVCVWCKGTGKPSMIGKVTVTEVPHAVFNPSLPDDIRASGWKVTKHYDDPSINGTRWVFTKDDGTFTTLVYGQGRTDAEALTAVRRKLKLPTE